MLTGVPSSKEYVNRYGSLLLTCVATDNSNVQIKWFRNGVEINHDVMVLYMVHEISDTLLGYYVSSLRINYATNVTNGTYSCRAQGIKHTEQFFTEVEVYCKYNQNCIWLIICCTESVCFISQLLCKEEKIVV